MKKIICLLSFSLFLLINIYPQEDTPMLLNEIYNFAEEQVQSIHNDVIIKDLFTIGLIVIGCALSAIQLFARGKKIKVIAIVTVLLGFSSSVLTGINGEVLKIDANKARNYYNKGQAVLRQMRQNFLDWKKPGLTPGQKQNYLELFVDLSNSVTSLKTEYDSTKLVKNEHQGNWLAGVFPAVYAQQNDESPFWIHNLPVEKNYIYIIGRAENLNLNQAKNDSFNNSILSFKGKIQPILSTNIPDQNQRVQFSDYLTRNITKVGEYGFYDANANRFVYYTLIKLRVDALNSFISGFELRTQMTLNNPNQIINGISGIR